MVEAIKKPFHQTTIEGLKARVNIFLAKVEGHKSKVKRKDGEAKSAIKKVNESVEVIWKIQKYIGNQGDVVNKSYVFDNHLIANPISSTKIITLLLDYLCKTILEDMGALFAGLELELVVDS